MGKANNNRQTSSLSFVVVVQIRALHLFNACGNTTNTNYTTCTYYRNGNPFFVLFSVSFVVKFRILGFPHTESHPKLLGKSFRCLSCVCVCRQYHEELPICGSTVFLEPLLVLLLFVASRMPNEEPNI